MVTLPAGMPNPTSRPCTVTELTSSAYLRWAATLRPAWDESGDGPPVYIHRKLWEWLFICTTLEEAGMLRPGRRGLGFGVGGEPLAAAFAARGCRIVATDLPPDDAARSEWGEPGREFVGELAGLNSDGLCDPETFAANVTYRPVNMNEIPDDLTGFDFVWSACAFEHLGSIGNGLEFLSRQMRCLRPGGVAVHTTEFNVGSDDETLDHTGTVLFRRRDLAGVAHRLRRDGHRVEVEFDTGDRPEDLHVDSEPFTNVHLKLSLGGFVTTSYGMVIVKASPLAAARAAARRRVAAVPPVARAVRALRQVVPAAPGRSASR